MVEAGAARLQAFIFTKSEEKQLDSDVVKYLRALPQGRAKTVHADTHRKPLQTLIEVAWGSGMLSTHLDLRHIIVRMNLIPSEAGRGPTTSVCNWLKRVSGTLNSLLFG